MTITTLRLVLLNWKGSKQIVWFKGKSGATYRFEYDFRLNRHFLAYDTKPEGPARYDMPPDVFNRIAEDVFTAPEFNPRHWAIIPVASQRTVEAAAPGAVTNIVNVNVSVANDQTATATPTAPGSEQTLAPAADPYAGMPRHKLMAIAKRLGAKTDFSMKSADLVALIKQRESQTPAEARKN